jgi:predicted Zn-dependent protease
MSGIFGQRGSYQRYPKQARGGLGVRLLIAAAFVIFALISFYGQSEQNPVTGEKQRVGMSAEQDVAMGLQAAPEMAQQHGGEVRDPQHAGRVNQIGQRLLSALDRWLREQGRQHPFEFRFHLLNDDQTINAFALPGGQVFITWALYSQLETDGQLAGVLAHEIGHVLERHGAQRLAKQKLTQGLAGAAGVAGGTYESARMAEAIGQMVNMKYGREDELESDSWGVRLTALAGYDPRAMLGVMKILDRASGGQGPPEIMSTHPKPANRVAYIENIIKQIWPNGVPEGLEP